MVNGVRGGFEEWFEAARAKLEAQTAAAAEKTKEAGQAAAAEIGQAFTAPPSFQAAIDVRSKEGYAGLLKSMTGGGGDVAKEQLGELQAQTGELQGIRSDLANVGVEAADL